MIPRMASALGAAALLLCSGGGHASDGLPPDCDRTAVPAFTLRGFGTLGLARTDSDQVEFVRDLSQPGGVSNRWAAKTDSRLGVQANFQPTERLEAVFQAVSHYRHDGSFGPDVTWAFVKLEPNPNFSLRGGRLGTDFYMLADSRHVGYSYLTVRPPGDYYGALPFFYVDGADGLATAPFGGGVLRGKIFTGVTREKAPLADRQWDLDGSRMSGAYADYQKGDWQWRLGYSQIRFKHDLPMDDLRNALGAAAAATGIAGAQEAAEALSVTGKLSRFYSAGMIHDAGPLQLHLMLSETRQESAVFEHSRSGYLTAGYRFGDVTPFLGYSRVRSKPKQLSTGLPDAGALAALNAAVRSVMADGHSDQHTFLLGARWDFRPNMALKAQLDLVHGDPGSIFPYRWEKPGFDGNVNVFSLALDFVF